MAVFGMYRLRVDWDGNGSFANSYAILTSYVRQSGVTVEYGRDRASMLVGRSTAGKLTAELDNSSRMFSRFWAASPLAGKLLPGRAVDYSVSTDGGATWRVLFTGRLSALETDLTPLKQDYRARLTATGPIGWINRDKRVAVPLMSSVKTGAAVNYILDAIEWPSATRTVEQGQSTMLRYYVRDTAALTALRDLEDTEGGFLRETRDGRLAFEDRSHRYVAPWNAPRATYTCDKSGAIRYAEIHPVDSLSDVYTVMQAKVRTFNITNERDLVRVTDLSQSKNTINYITLPPGQVVQIDCLFPPPNGIYNELAVGLWSTVILKATQYSNGTGTDLSAGIQFVDDNNVVISAANGNLDYGKFSNGRRLRMLNASGQTAYAVTLTCRGYAVIEGAGYQVSLEDQTAIGKYGRATYNYPGKYLTSMDEAQGLCQYNLDRYKEPRNAVRMTMMVNAAASHLIEAATVDVSDRIRIESYDGLAGDYYVEKIRHQVKDNCQHTVTLECTEAYGTTWAPSGEPYTPHEVESVPQEDLPTYIEEIADNAVADQLIVMAGVDQIKKNQATYPCPVTMAGSYIGGVAPVTYIWSVAAGPAGVTWTGQNTLNAVANLPEAGTYILRLTCTDGASVVRYDDMRVDVAAPQTANMGTGVLFRSTLFSQYTAGSSSWSYSNTTGEIKTLLLEIKAGGGGGGKGLDNEGENWSGGGGGEGELAYGKVLVDTGGTVTFAYTVGAGGTSPNTGTEINGGAGGTTTVTISGGTAAGSLTGAVSVAGGSGGTGDDTDGAHSTGFRGGQGGYTNSSPEDYTDNLVRIEGESGNWGQSGGTNDTDYNTYWMRRTSMGGGRYKSYGTTANVYVPRFGCGGMGHNSSTPNLDAVAPGAPGYIKIYGL